MRTIIKNIPVEFIKYESFDDISDIVKFTGADNFMCDSNRLFCYGSGISVMVKPNNYILKVSNKLMEITKEEFDNL